MKNIFYELPISKKVYDGIIKFEKKEIPSVMYKIDDEDYVDTVFLLAHGTSSGLIEINENVQLTSEQLLKSIYKNCIDRNIKNVVTICCHGGKQTSHEIEGVKISSFHNSEDIIQTKAEMLIDGDCIHTIII